VFQRPIQLCFREELTLQLGAVMLYYSHTQSITKKTKNKHVTTVVSL